MATTKPSVKAISCEDALTEMLNRMEGIHNRNTKNKGWFLFLDSDRLMWREDCFTFLNGRLVPKYFCHCGCLEVYKAYRKIIEEAHR